jgi:lipoprotein-anchoring transpeptidase ErfK/SrfK
MTHAARRPSRPPGVRRGAAAFAVSLLVAGVGCLPAAPVAAAEPAVPRSQPLVTLLEDHVARIAPDAHARRIETVPTRTPLTRVRTVLPALGYKTGTAGESWVHVKLPGRPNGHKGWILAAKTTATSTPWHLSLKLSTRRLGVYHDGRVVRRFNVVVGKRSTPTPRGRFFIEEALALSSHHAGGPFALATSARSNVLQNFEGGPGQIALHGTRGLSGAPGSAVSHGCIRLSTVGITWLAGRIGGGVPLTVTR